LDQERKKILENLQEQVQVTKTMSTLTSFSGIAAIPFAFIGVATTNKVLAACSLCWLVSYFIGYITRMTQEEHKQALMRFNIAEATFSTKDQPKTSRFQHRMSLN
jgi:hypothetical protein